MPGYPGTDGTRLAELGAFLKSRRARLQPGDVGFPDGSRRRTPGLRREEVAQLAGVGLTWYTWLEQGRGIRVSYEVLRAIARALELEPAERAHMFQLAGHEPPGVAPDECVREAHRLVLMRWEPFPALIAGRRWDVLAWNRAADAVWGYGSLPEGRRNLLWAAFMIPERRKLYADWEGAARQVVATFRADAAPYLGEAPFQALLAELRAESPDFARIWEEREVSGRRDGGKRLRHPRFGVIELEHTIYRVADQPGLTLRLYTARPGSRSEAVLREAAGERQPVTIGRLAASAAP
jgi:transcriptional regulator with XRE-family HTH domain